MFIVPDANNYRDDIQYCYFRKDHLGNNREVWCANTNGTVQRTQYYPSGLPWAEGEGQEIQNKKYNGKEWIEAHGLDEYDSQARMYYPAIMRTTTLDPLAEKYYSISPYAWCGNNPVNRIDPDGRDPKNIQHWFKFAKELYKSATIAVTVGLQLSVKTKLGKKPIGVDLNAASIDIISLRDGKFSPNANRPQIQKNAAIGIGLVGAEYSKEIKDNGKTTTVETKKSGGIIGMNREYLTTENFVEKNNGDFIPITTPKTEVLNKVDDIGYREGFIFVGEMKFNTEKIAKALGHLLNDK